MFRGSIVALVTPMNQDGSVDFSALSTLVNFHIENGTDAIVAVGTTGESATLSVSEHVAVVKAVVEQAAGRVPVIAGAGANSTAEAVALTKACDEVGADGMLSVTPYYNKPTQAGLVAHFSAIAAATDKPIILYNVPGRTCCDLKPEAVAELSRVKNIVGIKEATGDLSRVTPLRQLCGDDFLLLTGDDPTAMAFMLAGGDGVISVTNNVRPAQFKALCDASLSGDIVKARALDAQLYPLYGALFIEANPIPVKWAMEAIGVTERTVMRLPLTELSEQGKEKVREALVASEPV
ncbi:4-hydroxy-tetrahydrodipicolinate synthase [Ferrimonas balearica]|uniref:4-hydroxy-tetrahydrodipicolinate synthase n=1 Tax=Ferrimonas balearica TaxID=44012 RepID=UPI001F278BF1|nr:4-hydroxy-tetrahydrodipicolinate synthase [Ferrimonas balearica]MBY6017198.1 4-hydroxy-tetrahydrodipicolinate synthase [Halomonas denitrificans]MBY6093474.1 4-hydroxy-tetrahydrodipicolinate synthase [Ferrimonas balearica]